MASSFPRSGTPFREGRYLPDSFVPSKDIVIIGRGKKVYDHAGNRKLRAIVQSETQAYSSAENRAAKSKIIGRIFDAIRADSQVGFVKRDPSNKKYFAVDDTTAKTTIAQCFRNQLADDYKSSKKHKQHLREAMRRSRSDCGFAFEAMMNKGRPSHTVLRRCSSDGTAEFPAPDMSPDYFNSVDPIEMQSFNASPGDVHRILRSAASLLGGDDWHDHPSQGMADGMELISSSNATSGPPLADSRIPAKDVFSSLCSAFGSDMDVSSDPFEPVPIKDTSCPSTTKTDEGGFSQTKASQSPFYMIFDEAFGSPRAQASV